MNLESRYRRLLRLYPAAWRARRADEMVATYLDAAPPGRTRPSTSDRLDVARGAVRHRIALGDRSGLRTGASIAAELALLTAAVLAAVWVCRFEFAARPPLATPYDDAPIARLGTATWSLWIAVGLASTVLSRRWTRLAVFTALTATVLLVPFSMLHIGLSYFPPQALAPQIALGVLAFFLSVDRPRWRRALVPLAMVVTAGVELPARLDDTLAVVVDDSLTLSVAAAVLALAGLVFAVGYGVRRRGDGLWALLILVAPSALLYGLRPVPPFATGGEVRDWSEIYVAVLGIGLVVTGLVVVSLLVQNRLRGRSEASVATPGVEA